jgi:processive 1,2-diacylglycerol beta-glucosyltransferase
MNVGGGHLRAAQALQEAFRRLDAARTVRVADTMQYTGKLFRWLFLGGLFDVVQKIPEFYDWLYRHFDRPVASSGSRNLFEKLTARSVLRVVEEYRPDLVISTHALSAGIVSWLREKGRISVPHAIVVTDFDVHAMWVCRHCEQYCAASDDARQQLEALGAPPEKVAVTGIPIDPIFADPRDRDEAHRELGLDPERATILVTFGGWGFGPIEKIVRALHDLQSKVQVVVVCAMNQRLKIALDRRSRADGPVKIVPVGWTARMHTYMSAADLVLGKAGGLTVSEALAQGLPFLIVQSIKGQEEHNANYLLEEGAALRCDSLLTLAEKVDMLLNDSACLTRLRANARRLSRPHAACDIVRTLQRLEPGARGLTPAGAVAGCGVPDPVPT